MTLTETLQAVTALTENGNKLIIGVDEIMAMTGWSRNTTMNFMHREDFPLIRVGKELQVNILAFVEYTMERRV